MSGLSSCQICCRAPQSLLYVLCPQTLIYVKKQKGNNPDNNNNDDDDDDDDKDKDKDKNKDNKAVHKQEEHRLAINAGMSESMPMTPRTRTMAKTESDCPCTNMTDNSKQACMHTCVRGCARVLADVCARACALGCVGVVTCAHRVCVRHKHVFARPLTRACECACIRACVLMRARARVCVCACV